MLHNYSPRLLLVIDPKSLLVKRFADRRHVNTAKLIPPFTSSIYSELEWFRTRGPRAVPQGAA